MRYTDSELEAYLDEALSAEEMAAVESALRDDEPLAERLRGINARRDAGIHSLGEIWRRSRASCPSREQLGSYLLGALAPEHLDYIQFHLETVSCRFCEANLADLKEQQNVADSELSTRRSRYFQSSAGYLKPKRD